VSLEFYLEVARLLRAGRVLAVATVVGRQGSTPRSSGAKMIVTDSGETVFSVGGGAFEALVIEDAKEAIRAGRGFEREYRFTEQGDGATGMVCGGSAFCWMPVVGSLIKLVYHSSFIVHHSLLRPLLRLPAAQAEKLLRRDAPVPVGIHAVKLALDQREAPAHLIAREIAVAVPVG